MVVMAKKRTSPDYTPDAIRKLRKRLGLTQTQAAARVGVTQRAWLSWETGAITPSRQSLILIRLLDDGKI
jgi:DNA-binding transcriptional regulator YiaG